MLKCGEFDFPSFFTEFVRYFHFRRRFSMFTYEYRAKGKFFLSFVHGHPLHLLPCFSVKTRLLGARLSDLNKIKTTDNYLWRTSWICSKIVCVQWIYANPRHRQGSDRSVSPLWKLHCTHIRNILRVFFIFVLYTVSDIFIYHFDWSYIYRDANEHNSQYIQEKK